MTKSYKAILFDAGDTLVRLARPFPEIMRSVLAEVGWEADVDRLAAATDAVFSEAEEARAGVQEETQSADDLARDYWTGIYLEIGRRGGLPTLEMKDVDPIYEYMVQEQPYTPVEGARELLAWCRGRGYRLGLVSNWGTDLRLLLDRLELRPFFDTVVVSAEVGMEKPGPRIFLHALRELGAKAQETLFVGDDYYNDGMGAWAIGIDPLLLDRQGRYAAGVFPRVMRLADVRSFLEQGGVAE